MSKIMRIKIVVIQTLFLFEAVVFGSFWLFERSREMGMKGKEKTAEEERSV